MSEAILKLLKVPSITDWITAIGTFLGFPAALWGIVKLFKKDEEKERKLKALEDLAVSQRQLNEKIQLELEQLMIQTGEFQHQTNLMMDHNAILSTQVELQGKAFMTNEKYQQAAQELEQQKRRSEIKPDFMVTQTNAHQGLYHLTIRNAGHMANNIRVEALQPANLFLRVERTETRTNVSTEITIGHFPNLNFVDISFQLKVIFNDEDGNEYEQTVTAQSGHYSIERPQLVA